MRGPGSQVQEVASGRLAPGTGLFPVPDSLSHPRSCPAALLPPPLPTLLTSSPASILLAWSLFTHRCVARPFLASLT